jgi:hypothetical protein
MHDIENELVFKSNPGYVFHDSPGFEAGSTEEAEKVKNFITKRAEDTNLSQQLHAIWYLSYLFSLFFFILLSIHCSSQVLYPYG